MFSSNKALLKTAGTIPVFICVIAILFFHSNGSSQSFESTWLLGILNTIFLAFFPFVISAYSIKAFLYSNSSHALLLGLGTFSLGLASLIAGWVIGQPGSPNPTVTIHNTGALLGGMFHFYSSIGVTRVIDDRGMKFPIIKITGIYFTIAIIIFAVAGTSLINLTPLFFSPGHGPTLIRQFVLGAAAILYIVSSINFFRFYKKSANNFYFWYSLALALIAIGLSAVFLQKTVGSPIGWVGRCAQYIAGFYLLLSLILNIKNAKAKSLSPSESLSFMFGDFEHNYRLLMESISDAVICFDHEFRIFFCSKRTAALLDRSHDRIIGSDFRELFISEIDRNVVEKFMVAKEEATNDILEATLTSKNTNKLSVEYSLSKIRGDLKAGVTAVIRDVSSRKHTEKSIKDSEERYRIIVETAQEGIWSLNSSFATNFVNNKMAEMLGYSIEEILGKHISDFLVPEEIPNHTKRVQSRLAGQDGSYECCFHHKDGHRVWMLVSATAIKLENGQFSGAFAMLSDISELKEKTAQLDISIDNLTLAQSIGKIGNWEYDIECKSFWGSAEGLRIYGFPPMSKELSIEDVESCIPDRERVHQTLVNLIHNEDKYDLEFAVNPRDSSKQRIIHSIAKLIKDGKGNPQKVVGVVQDVTTRKQADEVLQKTHEQLLHAEKMSSIGNLSASIAHEFNNPLQGIMSIIQGVQKRCDLPQKDNGLVDLAIKECVRMRDLIKSLQDFNRPTSGRIAPMNIHAALDSILLLGKKQYNTRKIVIEKNYADDLPLIPAVGDQLRQVFLNLLNNAVDAINEVGSITIKTAKLDDNVVIRIHDTGCGITPVNIEHVFEPFFSTKSERKGTGLGLSISYGIIKEHGGDISVTSEPGKGTTFSVLLPIGTYSDGKKQNFSG